MYSRKTHVARGQAGGTRHEVGGDSRKSGLDGAKPDSALPRSAHAYANARGERGAASAAETQTDRLAKWANCMRHGWTDKEAQELGRRRHRSNETITISRGANPFGIEERRGEDRLPNGLLSADY